VERSGAKDLAESGTVAFFLGERFASNNNKLF